MVISTNEPLVSAVLTVAPRRPICYSVQLRGARGPICYMLSSILGAALVDLHTHQISPQSRLFGTSLLLPLGARACKGKKNWQPVAKRISETLAEL